WPVGPTLQRIVLPRYGVHAGAMNDVHSGAEWSMDRSTGYDGRPLRAGASMATPYQPERAESPAQHAKRIVEEFLEASMAPDPVRARTYMAQDVVIVFTGGRRFSDPSQSTAFNAARYRWVKKRIERTDVVAGSTAEEVIVYNIGTLYGE